MEAFKPIPEYEGIYEVSNKGTIRTDKNVVGDYKIFVLAGQEEK
ncbi:NUMOD4 domain-containing protein [Companilactobacillus alimentarius]